MNLGMELMGMKYCDECGDPFTSSPDNEKTCQTCEGSKVIRTLQAQAKEQAKEVTRLQLLVQYLVDVKDRDIMALEDVDWARVESLSAPTDSIKLSSLPVERLQQMLFAAWDLGHSMGGGYHGAEERRALHLTKMLKELEES